MDDPRKARSNRNQQLVCALQARRPRTRRINTQGAPYQYTSGTARATQLQHEEATGKCPRPMVSEVRARQGLRHKNNWDDERLRLQPRVTVALLPLVIRSRKSYPYVQFEVPGLVSVMPVMRNALSELEIMARARVSRPPPQCAGLRPSTQQYPPDPRPPGICPASRGRGHTEPMGSSAAGAAPRRSLGSPYQSYACVGIQVHGCPGRTPCRGARR